MWTTNSVPLAGKRGWRHEVSLAGRPASFREVLDGWRGDPACRALVLRLLAEAPFAAFNWEHPRVTRSTLGQPFEFVLLDNPALARVQPEPATFSGEYALDDDGDGIVTVPNLGGDAVLVIPTPLAEPTAYTHLAAFARLAPEPQRHAFLGAVAAALERRASEAPTWLSTAGLGVCWLHARLDSRPKYYRHQGYR